MTNKSKVSENIVKLVEEEIEKGIHERMCKYAEDISKIHGIPLKILRRDLPNPGGFCKGIKKGGELCTRKASSGSEYCLSHKNESKLQEPIIIKNSITRHNHPFPPMFKEGCPACEKMDKTELRDLSTLM
jgi:hypothetical protein